MVTKTKISEHAKTKSGSTTPSGARINVNTKGHGMYTFVHGKGSNRKSFTRHCSEAEADRIKASLE